MPEFEAYSGPRINYSEERVADCIHIRPASILYEHGIRDYHLQVSSDERYQRLFFKTNGDEVPFDLFGAAFWLITRYEEYLPYKADTQNRFHYRASLAYQYEFLHLPLVNVWLHELVGLLKARYPLLLPVGPNYQFISTFDIDNAYKYKFKGFVRTLAGIFSDEGWNQVKERLNIIMNRKQDPFDVYDFLIRLHKELGITSIFFFLLGDYGINDKNHSASDLRFQKLIKHIADYSIVGVHPSYGSNNNLKQLKKEVGRLSTIVHRVITKSRQHFSMLRFPQTYQDLLQAGISSDYTMGYTNHNGFRASYCFPYKWYSLDIEAVSTLTIHPFCISDNALLVLESPGNAMLEICMPLIAEVKKYGGECITLFHNDNLTPEMRECYQQLLIAAK